MLCALAQVTAPRGSPQLRLVGWITDEYRTQLEAEARELGIADRVDIVGGTDDAFTELERAHVLLMCSDHEAFGRVTVEALKCGRPVIGSRSGGTPELVADGEDGILFEPGDAASLATAIRRLAEDRGLLDRMSRRALERNPRRFTKSDEVLTLVTALQHVTRRKFGP